MMSASLVRVQQLLQRSTAMELGTTTGVMLHLVQPCTWCSEVVVKRIASQPVPSLVKPYMAIGHRRSGHFGHLKDHC